MKFCRQKFKHCFVACCASILGKDTNADQEAIVAQFPKELQQGKEDEGVAKSLEDVYAVVQGLGISKAQSWWLPQAVRTMA
jgi:hypothetical protein